MLTMSSVKILHAVRSAITATAELLVVHYDDISFWISVPTPIRMTLNYSECYRFNLKCNIRAARLTYVCCCRNGAAKFGNFSLSAASFIRYLEMCHMCGRL